MGVAKRIVAFGEVLGRMSPPLGEAMGHASAMSLWYGGAEANAVSAIAQLGGDAAMISTLPDNVFGRAAKAALTGRGVDTTGLRFADGRLGLYFASFGAGLSAPEVLYDRADSAFARDPKAADGLLDGAAYLHITGITPAVSAAASEAALTLARKAVERGVKVSFDGNYRAKLWAAWNGDGPSTLRELISLASLAFVDHRDIALITGESFADNEAAYARAFALFPRLELITATLRKVVSVNHHELGACAQARGGPYITLPALSLPGIVDRIGGGDAFAGAFLLAKARSDALADSLNYALHAGAAKHGQRGDALTLTDAELRVLMQSGPGDVRR